MSPSRDDCPTGSEAGQQFEVVEFNEKPQRRSQPSRKAGKEEAQLSPLMQGAVSLERRTFPKHEAMGREGLVREVARQGTRMWLGEQQQLLPA